MDLVSQLYLMRLGGPNGDRYEPIEQDAWRAAVQATPGIRIVDGGVRAPNLKTGEAAALWRQIPCDVEVAVIGTGDEPSWIPVFSWQDSGSATINRVFDPTDPGDPRTQALFALAEALSALVTDDRGQVLKPPGKSDATLQGSR